MAIPRSPGGPAPTAQIADHPGADLRAVERAAVALRRGAMAAEGAGLLPYLAKEGRGIGLVNKLRAYNLQDAGFDTLEANIQLGFDADERLYLPAAKMLRQLGHLTVRLMTNNPDKVRGLERNGVTVAERVPLVARASAYNDADLATKAKRFGHIL